MHAVTTSATIPTANRNAAFTCTSATTQLRYSLAAGMKRTSNYRLREVVMLIPVYRDFPMNTVYTPKIRDFTLRNAL